MISTQALVELCAPLERPTLERWIELDWIRPDRRDGACWFREIDVARVQLILELRGPFEVNEAALPIVLSLLDQVYDLRREMRGLVEGFERGAPSAM